MFEECCRFNLPVLVFVEVCHSQVVLCLGIQASVRQGGRDIYVVNASLDHRFASMIVASKKEVNMEVLRMKAWTMRTSHKTLCRGQRYRKGTQGKPCCRHRGSFVFHIDDKLFHNMRMAHMLGFILPKNVSSDGESLSEHLPFSFAI